MSIQLSTILGTISVQLSDFFRNYVSSAVYPGGAGPAVGGPHPPDQHVPQLSQRPQRPHGQYQCARPESAFLDEG